MLENKLVYITGASRGIGLATATVCAKHGATIILNGRSVKALHAIRDDLKNKYNTEVHVLSYDICDIEAVKSAFQWIKNNVGRLDVMVNNAGLLDDALLGMINNERMSSTFAVNVEAAIIHMQYASRLMMRQKSGSIINISSIMGRYGDIGQVVYSSTKAALIGATYSAAKELAPYNIRVNAVAPGVIETDMVNNLSEEAYQKRLAQIKMKRIGKPEEVANTVMFLASELSSYVTGQVIGVDGGMVI